MYYFEIGFRDERKFEILMDYKHHMFVAIITTGTTFTKEIESHTLTKLIEDISKITFVPFDTVLKQLEKTD